MRNKNFAYLILGLNAVLGWVSYWSLGRSVFDGEVALKWVLPFALFSIWAIAFSLIVVFVRSRKLIYGSILISSIGYLAFVDFGWSFLGLFAGTLVLIYAERTAKKELDSGVHIHFYKVVNQPLKYFVSAVCLVAAVAYYFSIENQQNLSFFDVETEAMKKEIEIGLEMAGRIFSDKEELIREIQGGMTIDEYILQTQLNGAEAMVENFGIDAAMKKNLSVPIDSGVINDAMRDQALAAARMKASEDLGIEIAGNEPVKDIIVTFIDKKQDDFVAEVLPKKPMVTAILALGFFLAVRLIGTAIDLVLGLVIMGIIKILVGLGVITMKSEMKEVAVVEYSV